MDVALFMDFKTQVVVIIPALEPDDRLIMLVKDLRVKGFSHILVVNDGSPAKYDVVFDTVRNEYGCAVFTHAINLGKGRALKNAFNHVLVNYPNCMGVVTADSDGQHTPEDIAACARKLVENPDNLILGCRPFHTAKVPLHNLCGNLITKKVTEIFVGLKLTDTQTGLRAMPKRLMQMFMVIKGERFEFEMNMLLRAKEYGIKIIEVPISVIYAPEGQSTHFNVWKDSLLIYVLFAKFFISSLFSFAVDILVFTFLAYLLRPHFTAVVYIFIASFGARAVSSLTNYTINKKGVFKCKGQVRKTLLKYYTLCITQICVSAGLVYALHVLSGLHETPVKIVVDTLLFFISFQIQREWVFKNKKY